MYVKDNDFLNLSPLEGERSERGERGLLMPLLPLRMAVKNRGGRTKSTLRDSTGGEEIWRKMFKKVIH